jgi:hypothetical protein
MRKKGRSIKDIAKEFGETEWYVRTAIRLQMTTEEAQAAAKLCKELASQTGVETQKRRRRYRQMLGDVEFHEVEPGRIRLPLPKTLGVYVDRELLTQVKDRADREGTKLSQLIFPLIQDHLELAGEGIDKALRRLLA